MVKAINMAFELPQEDVDFLEGLGLKWETVIENGVRLLILHDYIMHEAFNPEKVFLHLRIPEKYESGAALDMFFTSPLVTRKDKRAIPNFTEAGTFAGRTWWQWSRHRKEPSKWRPGEDSIVTHLSMIQRLLAAEGAGKQW